MGKSLSFRGAVYEAQDALKKHVCKDPICGSQRWRIQHQLQMTKLRLNQLERQLLQKGVNPEALPG